MQLFHIRPRLPEFAEKFKRDNKLYINAERDLLVLTTTSALKNRIGWFSNHIFLIKSSFGGQDCAMKQI